MKNVNVIRSADWRDMSLSVALTLEEATAMKNVGLRWKCKAIQRAGESAIFALVSAQCAGECGTEAAVIVQMTARNVITACAFCAAEMTVCDADSGAFWRGGMRMALENLSRTLEAVQKNVIF